MLYVGIILVAIAALGFLVLNHVRFWDAYYRPDESAVDEIHYARTVDGWRLALHRYRGRGDRADQPLILCHGLGANRYTFDLAPEVSLARFLQEQGWDVWLLELRGVGRSRRDVPLGQRGWDWSFDDYLTRDVPAAIDRVLTLTGAPAVHWVGHSMGGILMWAFLQGNGAVRVRSLTAIGSPAFFDPTPTVRTFTRVQRATTWLPVLRVRPWARFFSPFYVGMRLQLISFNGANVEGRVLRMAGVHLIANICGGVARQLSAWANHGTFRSNDHDWQRGLAAIRTPVLAISGEADPFAPPSEMRRIVDALGSDERRLTVLGQRTGCKEDYGHGDLLFGRDVRRECFPTIAEWLEARSHDALPPPVPDTTLELPTASAPLARPVEVAAEPTEHLVPPQPSAIPGPFGLLNRYSPTRRARWVEARKRFREVEKALWSERETGGNPATSRLSLRRARGKMPQAPVGVPAPPTEPASGPLKPPMPTQADASKG